MLPAKNFYAIRHGQTDHNIAQIAAGGLTDSQLTEAGRQMAIELAPLLTQLETRPVRIFHSPMSRARDTAELLNAELDLPMEEVADLREMELGEWEEQPWSDVVTLIDKTEPPGGETNYEYAQRIKAALTDCLGKCEQGEIPMFVAHGGMFHALGFMYDIYKAVKVVGNCQLHYFEPHNDHPFFPWKVQEFVIDQKRLSAQTAHFCSSQLGEDACQKTMFQ